MIFDLVLIFVLSVYMLLYGQQIGRLARRVMPKGDETDADDYPHLVQRAVSRYVGGQLLFSIVMGASCGVSLWIFGLVGLFPDGGKYAIAFGVFYGAMELIPYIGPILGAAPPTAVALFTHPISAVWLIVLFIVLQQFEGHVVAPQVFGHTLRAAARTAGSRHRRSADRAADPLRAERDSPLPQAAPRAGILGSLAREPALRTP